MGASSLTPKQRQAKARRRERMKSEVRDLVFRACSVFGILLAMPWALSYEAPKAKCPSGVGECVGTTLNVTLMPILLRIGFGLGIGVAVGLLLCLTVPGLKRREV